MDQTDTSMQTTTRGGARALAGALVAIAAVASLGACTSNEPKGLAEEGKVLARQKGCVSCHTTDGRPSVGPTWKGVAGSKVVLDDGTTVTANDAYLTDSILHPSAQTVKGFKAGQMETVIKENSLTQDQVKALVAYIKSLR
jgi:cytochrome c oxidase subunit 2